MFRAAPIASGARTSGSQFLDCGDLGAFWVLIADGILTDASCLTESSELAAAAPRARTKRAAGP